MVSRRLLRAVIVAAALAFPALAEASPGWATGTVALRTGPGTAYARLTVIPAGARLQVYRCARWCEVVYGSVHGWAAGGYISTPGGGLLLTGLPEPGRNTIRKCAVEAGLRCPAAGLSREHAAASLQFVASLRSAAAILV